MVRKQFGELGKVSEEGERNSKEETAARYRHIHAHPTYRSVNAPSNSEN